MTKIYFLLNKFTQFFSWLNNDVVLKSWHLQAIAITIVLMFLLILRYLRKSRIEKNQIIQTGRSEIIGLKLTDHKTINDRIFNQQIQEQSFLSEQETHDKPWGQSTKEWRRLREEIRKLQHDITKNKRTEGQLNKQITELKNSNEQLKEKLIKYQQIKDELNLQINELKTCNELPQKEITSIKYDSNIEQTNEETAVTEEINTEAGQNRTEVPLQTTILGIESKNDLPPRLSSRDEASGNNPDEIVIDKTEQTEELKINQNIPLDIKELKSIADLVKRLQGGGQRKA